MVLCVRTWVCCVGVWAYLCVYNDELLGDGKCCQTKGQRACPSHPSLLLEELLETCPSPLLRWCLHSCGQRRPRGADHRPHRPCGRQTQGGHQQRTQRLRTDGSELLPLELSVAFGVTLDSVKVVLALTSHGVSPLVAVDNRTALVGCVAPSLTVFATSLLNYCE